MSAAAEALIASALELRLRSVPLGTRLRLMLEEIVSDGLGGWKAGPHVVGWVERPAPGELRVRLLNTEAGRTARALLAEEVLDVVLSRGHPPVVRLM